MRMYLWLTSLLMATTLSPAIAEPMASDPRIQHRTVQVEGREDLL